MRLIPQQEGKDQWQKPAVAALFRARSPKWCRDQKSCSIVAQLHEYEFGK